MAIVPAMGEPPPRAALREAERALAAGQVVVVPTDTVYGVAADPAVASATSRIFEVKQRSRDVALPLLVADVDQALSLATAVPSVAKLLMERFWPGALTVVLPRRPGLQADLGDDDDTVGVRCPAHPVPLALCRSVGPLATTSANLHGQDTPATAPAVAEVFGETIAVVLDGGPCTGAPSTVVDCTGDDPKLLREGRIPWTEVLAAL